MENGESGAAACPGLGVGWELARVWAEAAEAAFRGGEGEGKLARGGEGEVNPPLGGEGEVNPPFGGEGEVRDP